MASRARRWSAARRLTAIAVIVVGVATAAVWLTLRGPSGDAERDAVVQPFPTAPSTSAPLSVLTTVEPTSSTDAPSSTAEAQAGTASPSDTVPVTGSAPVRWAGRVKVPQEWTVELDEIPVTVANAWGDVSYRDGELGYRSGGMAEWTSSAEPSFDQCITMLKTAPLAEPRVAKTGLKRCVMSDNKHVAFLQILSIDRDGRMTLGLKVWDTEVG